MVFFGFTQNTGVILEGALFFFGYVMGRELQTVGFFTCAWKGEGIVMGEWEG